MLCDAPENELLMLQKTCFSWSLGFSFGRSSPLVVSCYHGTCAVYGCVIPRHPSIRCGCCIVRLHNYALHGVRCSLLLLMYCGLLVCVSVCGHDVSCA